MSALEVPENKMSVDDALAWSAVHADGAVFELQDGYLRPKYGSWVLGKWEAMAGDKQGHNFAKTETGFALRQALKSAGSSCRVFIDGVCIRTGDESYRVPDVVVDCGKPEAESAFASKPVILVEIISKGSVGRDVHAKLFEYFAIESVMHYLVVYPEDHRLVHHERDAGMSVKTQILTDGELALNPPGLTLSVTDLFGDMS